LIERGVMFPTCFDCFIDLLYEGGGGGDFGSSVKLKYGDSSQLRSWSLRKLHYHLVTAQPSFDEADLCMLLTVWPDEQCSALYWPSVL